MNMRRNWGVTLGKKFHDPFLPADSIKSLAP